jgi:3-dehydroquinate synthase
VSGSPEAAPEAVTERVALSGSGTDVVLGAGTRRGLVARVRQRFPRARRLAVAVDANVARAWPPRRTLSGLNRDDLVLRVPGGEAAKTRAVLARLQDRLLDLLRDEPVVAVGGGAALDVVGFAAATTRRGLGWVAVPTTVVAMADAAVGGKVAVNHPRGKNLLGAFHPPVLVVADVDFLATLPARDVTAGLAEVWKAGRVGDPELVEALARGAPADAAAWVDALRRSVAVKARLVEADERDAGARRALNYGHTVGHALESHLGNDLLRHGEAVAIGMVVAARIACARGLVGERAEADQVEGLRALGLPVEVPAGVDVEALLERVRLDKKRRPGAAHTFALPTGDRGVAVVEDVTDEEVRSALLACRRATA